MILYKNAKIITMSEAGILEKGWILVDGQRIVDVGSIDTLNETAWGNDLQIIDLTGYTVLPGLINGHHHCAMWKCFGGVASFDFPSFTQAYMSVRLANDALKKGVLAVRDLGHHGDGHMLLKKARDEGILVAPRIRGVNEMIALPGCHAPLLSKEVSSPEELRMEILHQANEKSDFIKVVVTHERMTHIEYEDMTCPWMPQEYVELAAKTAHQVGLPIAAHVNGRLCTNWCIDADFDVIEHGRYITDEMARKMAAKGITYVPTLSGQFANASPGWGREDMQARFARSWKLLEISMENTVKHGVNICAGTDCLGSVCEEISLLHTVGHLSPLDALKAATIKNAKLMGMEKDIGSVEKGKFADFIAVDKDPLADLNILEDHVKYISLDGKWYETAWFAAMVPPHPFWAQGF